MTLIEVAKVIGDALTQIDTTLQTPGLSDADWQALYAMRKHLDDLQRDLIGESIEQGNAQYQALTTQLKDATKALAQALADIKKVGDAIGILSQIAAYADQMLKLAA
jgi:uncharacterized protein YukE